MRTTTTLPAGAREAPRRATIAPDRVIRRKCACCADGGRHGGDCAGLRDGALRVSAPGDADERAADRVAEHVMHNAAPREEPDSRGTATPHVLQRLAESPSAATQARAGAASGVQTPGRPLDAPTRRFFEPRFGHDFADVRVHADHSAAEAARTLDARAYTFGTHIVFGRDQYQPAGESGRRLLAHELAHVVQSSENSKAVIHRKETDDAERKVLHLVGIEISLEDDLAVDGGYYVDRESASADLGTLYPGDVFTLSAKDAKSRDLTGQVVWELPPELEEITRSGSRIQLRAASEVPANIEIGLTDGTGRRTALRLKVAQLPAPQAINPDLEQNVRRRADLRKQRRAARGEFRAARREQWQEAGAERRRLRGAQREERQHLRAEQREERQQMPAEPEVRRRLRSEQRAERQELRTGQGEERQQMRAEQREARQALRGKRGEERREFRESAQELRRTYRELAREDSCGLPTEREIQRALERAIAVAGAARDALATRGPFDPQLRPLLQTCLRWTPDPAQPVANARVVARVRDMLAMARNAMATSVHSQFVCAGACDKETGAFVRQGSRGGTVTVCQSWTNGSISFPAASNRDDARAHALLHEFLHLSGPIPEPEKYFGRAEWAAQSAEEALAQADGYAAFAFKLAGGGAKAQP